MAHEINHACIVCGKVRVVKRAHIERGRKLLCTRCNGKRSGELVKKHKDLLDLYRRYQVCRCCGNVFEQNFLNPKFYCSNTCQNKKRNNAARMGLIALKMKPTRKDGV